MYFIFYIFECIYDFVYLFGSFRKFRFFRVCSKGIRFRLWRIFRGYSRIRRLGILNWVGRRLSIVFSFLLDFTRY